MGRVDDSELEYLVWDTSGVDPADRDAIVEDVLTDLGGDVAVVADPEDLDTVTDGDLDTAVGGESVPGPRVGEIGEPELLLIVLESTLIAIESAKVGKKVKDTVAGSGVLTKERFRSALQSHDQSVDEASADSLDAAIEAQDPNS